MAKFSIKRFEELQQQANEVEFYSPASGHTVWKFNAEKFGELVVKECIDRAQQIAIAHSVEEGTYAAGKKAGAFECAEDLKQYFGVK